MTFSRLCLCLLALSLLTAPVAAEENVLLVFPLETPGDYQPLAQEDLMTALEQGFTEYAELAVVPRRADLAAPTDIEGAIKVAENSQVPYLVWGSLTFTRQMEDTSQKQKLLRVKGDTDVRVLLRDSGRLFTLKTSISRSLEGPAEKVQQEEKTLARECVANLSQSIMDTLKKKLEEPPPAAAPEPEGQAPR